MNSNKSKGLSDFKRDGKTNTIEDYRKVLNALFSISTISDYAKRVNSVSINDNTLK